MGMLKKMQSKTIFLQETHHTVSEDVKIKKRCRGGVFSEQFTSQARGVMTSIHGSIPFNTQ